MTFSAFSSISSLDLSSSVGWRVQALHTPPLLPFHVPQKGHHFVAGVALKRTLRSWPSFCMAVGHFMEANAGVYWVKIVVSVDM